MYLCPLCELEYSGEVPANCERCKRPLVINGRYRINQSVELDERWGEDFDAQDLKTGQNIILRELRVKHREMPQYREQVDRYQSNVERLQGTRFEDSEVLLNAFEKEFKNSTCFYMVFSEDIWSALGSELYEASDQEDYDPLATTDGDALDDDFNLDDLDDLDGFFDEDKPPAPKPAAPSKASAGKPAEKPAPGPDAPPPQKRELTLEEELAASDEDDGDGISDDDLAFLENMLSDVDGGEGSDDEDLPDYLKESSSPAPSKGGGGEQKKGAVVKAKKQKSNLPAKTGGGIGLPQKVKIAASAGIAAVLIAILILVLL